jgi:FixJ family two-component response regulator
MDDAIEIAILEPHTETRAWLARMLRDAGYYPLLFESEMRFFCAHDIRRAACLIADDSLPVLSSVQMQLLLSRLSYKLPVIFLSSSPTIEKTVTAIRGGAVDFLPKPVTANALLAAVRLAVAIRRQGRETQEHREAILTRFAELTAREREVLAYVVAGRMNKQTAAILGIGEKTIKVHRSRVMQKLGARTLPELMHLLNAADLFSQDTTPASALAAWDWDIVEDHVAGSSALAPMFHLPEPGSRRAPIRTFIERVHTEDAPSLRAAIDEAIASRQPFQARYRLRGESGEDRLVLACGRVMFRGDNPVHFPGVALEIDPLAVPLIKH